MIRGAVYRVDLGRTRGHEQHGRRLGLVVSPTASPLSVATVIPTSTSAAASLARPAFVIAGRQSRLLVDQIRTVDVDYIVGEPVDYLDHGQMLEVEWAMARYLGLIRPLEPRPDPP